MILFPAIDLKDGNCVRLRHGEMATATVFNDDPGAQAAAFAAQGFTWVHIVDLNGAFAGRPVNGAAVDGILAAVNIPVRIISPSSRKQSALTAVVIGYPKLRE